MLATAASRALTADPTASGLGWTMERLAPSLGVAPRWRVEPRADLAQVPADRNDIYFGVERCHDEPALSCLLRALAQAAWSIAPILVSSSLSLLDRHQVLRPLTNAPRFLGLPFGHSRREDESHVRSNEVGDLTSFGDLSRRQRLVQQWLLGHQYFFVLDQLLILATVRLREALDGHAWVAAAAELANLRELLLSSTAAMSLVGDMAPEEYVDVIRVHVRAFHPDMTALHQADHVHLQRLFRDCQFSRRLDEGAWPADVRSGFADVQVARALLLTGHLKVCERSVGTATPSIHSEAKKNEQAAVDTIAALNATRGQAFALEPLVGDASDSIGAGERIQRDWEPTSRRVPDGT